MKKNNAKSKRILKRLGEKVYYFRRKINITQEKLAEQIDAERSYIAAIEKGNKSPSIYFLYELSEALNISLKDLMDIKVN